MTYKTITGSIDFVDIGDASYGEWIVYENKIPKFHVNIFREESESDSIIKNLIENKNQSIEFILKEINVKLNRRLTLYKRPILEIVTSSEMHELNLKPFPADWLSKLNYSGLK